MNLTQTRHVLSYIAATHPNFPKYSDEDRQRVALSYFRILWKYNIHDVLDAVDNASRKTRPYVPSVYDIESEISPSYEIHLPDEYYQLDKQLEILRSECEGKSYAEWISAINACSVRMLELRENAFELAEMEYRQRESMLSSEDRSIAGILE